MWNGILCDCCEARPAAIWIEADMEVEREKADNPWRLGVEVDLCLTCLRDLDPSLVEVREYGVYEAGYVFG